jgi:hypothetical protein
LINAFVLPLAIVLIKFSLAHRHHSKFFGSRDFCTVVSGSVGVTMGKSPHSRDNDFAIAGKGWVKGGKQFGFDDYEQSKA